ncbi:type II toxin-antitoxin system PemK/MazF family toxin [Microbacterium sp. zg.Y625]|uniref:type II toxin-antitoxin system PemK/MazF family toxin n=1 Tax=Microbacterium jiangjiandongii TaxID=3049071 RepID=UPI00214C5D96|nr:MULTISPECIES: type II toxin-antitoxin system PemK/MazF family toxin [unclassified Microbacterium]MCR2792698.1 type II toxin-antitoxin system PemK/MazF family toxin [Microbacterium sp. zg.Y625]WIM26677.1 type II toxin-antitoxin system PemK/MazF family toxin [Microbacterium sp. zg-Y625]
MESRSILHRLAALLRPSRRRNVPPAAGEPGRSGVAATVEVDPRSARALRIAYAPERDGAPDAGEVVWTWVPYAERDGRGKDRPVLVIARQSADRVYAVKLTSKPRDGDRDHVPLGAGEWDAKGRPSWVDVDQLYSVHAAGMRREASAVDRATFARVADALRVRHGYRVAP